MLDDGLCPIVITTSYRCSNAVVGPWGDEARTSATHVPINARSSTSGVQHCEGVTPPVSRNRELNKRNQLLPPTTPPCMTADEYLRSHSAARFSASRDNPRVFRGRCHRTSASNRWTTPRSPGQLTPFSRVKSTDSQSQPTSDVPPRVDIVTFDLGHDEP